MKMNEPSIGWIAFWTVICTVVGIIIEAAVVYAGIMLHSGFLVVFPYIFNFVGCILMSRK